MMLGVLAAAIRRTVAGGTETDPYWDSVVALLHFDGDLVDQKSRVWSPLDSPTISSDVFKFGTGSIQFNGSNRIETPDDGSFTFGTDDFTVEMFVRYASVPSTSAPATLFSKSGASGRSYALTVDAVGFTFRYTIGGTDVVIPLGTYAAVGTFNHVAITRRNGLISLFVNGVKNGADSADAASAHDVNDAPLTVGCLFTGSVAVNGLNGHVDEVRITKGVARYTADFTPPTKAFPNVGPAVVAPTPPAIGEYWTGQGGYYVGDITYADGRQFHLVMTPKADIVTLKFRTGSNDVAARDLYDGYSNQQLILASDAEGTRPAIEFCRDYRGGGFDDWYLLSVEEFKAVWPNTWKVAHPEFTSRGGTYQWLSYVYNAHSCGVFKPADGTTYLNGASKGSSYAVNPIRRVTKAS